MKVRESFSRVVGVGCAGNCDARTTDHGGFLGACDVISVGVSPAKAAARRNGVRDGWFVVRLSSRDVSPASR